MKNALKSFVIFCFLFLFSCGNDYEELQKKKNLIDPLLKGNTVSFYDLCFKRQDYYYGGEKYTYWSPATDAKELGYSEEDVAKLKYVQIVIPQSILEGLPEEDKKKTE